MGDCLSGCSSNRNSVFGGSSCLWILILLFCCGGSGNSFGNSCGDGNDCSCIIWILLILCLCGNNNNGGCGCGCGC